MQSVDSNKTDAWAKLVPLDLPLDTRNLTLTKISCTIGKAATNDIQIFDSRIGDIHCRIYKESDDTDDLYWIQNLSRTGIVIEDKAIKNRKKHSLAPGDKIGFLSRTKKKPEAILIHIFCPANKDSNKVKRCREENQTELEENNKYEKHKSFCDVDGYRNNRDCLHNFCASCISGWILESKVCPNCKQEYSDLNKNPKLDEVINSFIAANPDRKEPKEYYDEKDKKDRIKPLPAFEVVTFSDGATYEGEWINGRKQGKGKMIYSKGNVYEGKWMNGRKQGKGKRLYADGRVYEGDWVNDKMEGKGKMIWANGAVYEGDWVNDNLEGKGKLKYLDGAVYEGDWINNIREGKGKVIYAEGYIYEGGWVDDNLEGKGKLTYPDGAVYEGDWVKNIREGKGKLTYCIQMEQFMKDIG